MGVVRGKYSESAAEKRKKEKQNKQRAVSNWFTAQASVTSQFATAFSLNVASCRRGLGVKGRERVGWLGWLGLVPP